jgi:hypothetical protein
MRRWIAFLALFLISCQLVSQAASGFVPPTRSLPAPTIAMTAATETPAPSPTATSTLLPPTATLPLAPSATTAPASPEPATFGLRLHPDGPIYVGDQVSFEVIAPAQADMEGKSAQVRLTDSPGDLNAQAGFGRHGIGGRQQANLLWAWDTSQLPAGGYTLTVSIQPDGPTWSETVSLLPHGQVPPPEPQARWESESTACCTVFYITGTTAERDLAALLEMVEEQVSRASQRMAIQPSEPIQIVWLPRVLGHGGFASREIAISYLDRNYIAGDEATILHHEIIHILDSRLGGELRPSALVEGLAVYRTGGHYKPEPIFPRAAALLPAQPGCIPWSQNNTSAPTTPSAEGCGIGRYIPLKTLIDNFYFEQHEIGYLEAAALIEYMVDIWGWEGFSAFYRDIHPLKTSEAQTSGQSQAQSDAVEAALQKHFGLSLAQLEQQFIAALSAEQLSPDLAEDLRLGVIFYDTARRYQLALDPSAHFLTAWLMDNEQMRKREIVADYTRRPTQPEALALETMLAAAGESLRQADFNTTAQLLKDANAVLDFYPQQGLQAFANLPLANDYLKLIQAALAAGYQPQRVRLEGNTARVWVSTSGLQLSELSFIRDQENWLMSGLSGLNFLGPDYCCTGRLSVPRLWAAP